MKATPIWILSFICPVALGQLSTNSDELLNWCLDGTHHKSKPGPEDELHQHCSPWRHRSCCTVNTTREVHNGHLYKFNYDHCSHRRNISDDCRRHFRQDHCFFECSPNVGPWIVKVEMKTRKERFYKVPLCQSDCDAWFEACKDDYTCTDNWIRNWNWTKQGNECWVENECRTFLEVFKTAENFCQKVWDDAWQYTLDDQPCMRLTFDGNQGNPNDNTARLKVEELMRQYNSATSPTYACQNFSTIIILHLCVIVSFFFKSCC